MHLLGMLVAVLLQQGQNTMSDDSGQWIGFLLVLTAGVGGLVVWRKNSDRFHAYLDQHEMKSTGGLLPPTLRPSATVWQPVSTVKDCYLGVRNGFEVAIFKAQIGSGEGMVVRDMIAVRRDAFVPAFSDLVPLNITVDTASNPGWIIVANAGRRLPVLDAVLQALTV